MNNNLSVSVREAEPRDVGCIARLIRKLAEYERLVHEVELDPAHLSMHLFGTNPKVHALVAATSPGEIVGFALYFFNFSTFLGRPGLYLEDLFVLEEYRGQGIGLQLFRALGRIATEEQCGRIEWSVLNWNDPAINFYEKLGAIPMNEWTVYRLTGTALDKFCAESGGKREDAG
jgi:GNAT superfamily N-acetyltransferase